MRPLSAIIAFCTALPGGFAQTPANIEIAPQLLQKAEPEYSDEARAAGLEGAVIVTGTITKAYQAICGSSSRSVSAWMKKRSRRYGNIASCPAHSRGNRSPIRHRNGRLSVAGQRITLALDSSRIRAPGWSIAAAVLEDCVSIWRRHQPQGI